MISLLNTNSQCVLMKHSDFWREFLWRVDYVRMRGFRTRFWSIQKQESLVYKTEYQIWSWLLVPNNKWQIATLAISCSESVSQSLSQCHHLSSHILLRIKNNLNVKVISIWIHVSIYVSQISPVLCFPSILRFVPSSASSFWSSDKVICRTRMTRTRQKTIEALSVLSDVTPLN